jgi:hypothetical protein
MEDRRPWHRHIYQTSPNEKREGAATVFEVGEWKSEFVVGSSPQPTLIARDGQHEYVFAAQDEPLSR